MKKTKVYVDVEPRKIATQLVDLENEQFNCVMLLFDTDIKPVEVVIDPKFKAHDRELVKKVCENIRSIVMLMFSQNPNNGLFLPIISRIDEIEREFGK